MNGNFLPFYIKSFFAGIYYQEGKGEYLRMISLVDMFWNSLVIPYLMLFRIIKSKRIPFPFERRLKRQELQMMKMTALKK